MNNKYLLYRNDALLGKIEVESDDFPWYYGKFEPTTAFANVKPFFDKSNQLIQDKKFGSAEWEENYSQIRGDKIEVVSENDESEKMIDPIIHIESNKIKWR